MGSPRSTFWIAVCTTCILKLLLLKSYRSTDFEVHRNWLAITHSLPMDRWYYEETSEWTLDYPPFFAYFEWMLSHAAKYFDSKMLEVTNLDYASNMTILFQKLSVITSDFVLAYGVQECFMGMKERPGRRSMPGASAEPLMHMFALVFINGGLFMVDHIHFQYNGFLFGILLISIARIIQEKFFQGALFFAVLLNFKHIFLYMAPAFGVYLFFKYCIQSKSGWGFGMINFKNLFGLGAIVLSVFAVSFGPFYQHIPQIMKRLFPFKRGLSHAYWAPNFWAAYNTLDLVLNFALKRGKSGVTTGLVGESSLAILPQIQPIHTFVLTVIFMLPALWKVMKSPTGNAFLHTVILTAWTSFMFGYHVHEKAILNVIIPFSIIAHDKPKQYFLTLVAGTVSLFPLLFTPFEVVFKAMISVFHFSLCSAILLPSLRWFELAYVLGFIPVYLFENLSQLIFPQLPFLPLIVLSDYCLLGLAYSYFINYWEFIISSDTKTSRSTQPSTPNRKPVSPTTPMTLRKRK